MRNLVTILVALLLASGAYAGVAITCSTNGNDVTISWDASQETELVRAFALDVTVDSGTIDAYKDPNGHYNIYPGSIVIDGAGNVTDYGSPIADAAEYPNGTCGGLGTQCVTIEMGSLYAQGDPTPPAAGDLITLTVSGECCVTITENVIRGGVVMEDPAVPANPSFGTCCVTGACPCLGDVVVNGQIDFDDLFAVVDMLIAAAPSYIVPVPAGHCADIAPAGAPNGQVDFDDLFAVVDMLIAAAPSYIVPCP
jgi:hypothetical protein